MIVPKKDKLIVKTDLIPEQPAVDDTTMEEVAENPMANIYKAVKRALLTIKESDDDPLCLPYFRTIAIDNGQFTRLVLADNTEIETPLPAIFIHFVNVRYLVQQNRIGEGRATMRIRFVTNILNNQDDEVELTPFYLFQKINIAIQDAKNTEPALNERCQLTYFDMPETTNMLQAYWIDYEVWFRETSAWVYKDWVKRYIIMPPFTNHSDAPDHNKDGHDDHSETYEEASQTVLLTGDAEIIPDTDISTDP